MFNTMVTVLISLLLGSFSTASSNIQISTNNQYLIKDGVVYHLTPLFQETNIIINFQNITSHESLEFKEYSSRIDSYDIPNLMEDEEEEESDKISPDDSQFWVYIIVSISLTLFAGLASGLTVGLLSIDQLVLELKINNGTEEEKKSGLKILPILHKHHLLMVTLLISNACAMEALPIFLDALVPSAVAIVISVTAVLFFGEIIPQAICTGPNQVKIAAYISPFVKLLMFILFPLAWPISKILDCLLGHHGRSRFQNSDLKTLIELHSLQALETLDDFHIDENGGIGLRTEQTKLILSAMEMHKETVRALMIPYDKVYSISNTKKITMDTIKKILKSGFSRIPVYNGKIKNDVCGILLVKSLMGIVIPEGGVTLKEMDIELKRPIVVDVNMNLGDLLKSFAEGVSHMAIITDDASLLNINFDMYQASKETSGNAPIIQGLVTMEDIFENLIQGNILDEADLEKVRNPGLIRLMSSHRGESFMVIRQHSGDFTNNRKSSQHERQQHILKSLMSDPNMHNLVHRGSKRGVKTRQSQFIPLAEQKSQMQQRLLSESEKDSSFTRDNNQRHKTVPSKKPFFKHHDDNDSVIVSIEEDKPRKL